MELTTEPRQRQMDHSNVDARKAIAETLARFGAWRVDLSRFAGKVERRFSDAERAAMLARCATIEGELLMARTDLLLGLADAPQKVVGHSRVVDVERALDNVAAAVGELRAKLG